MRPYDWSHARNEPAIEKAILWMLLHCTPTKTVRPQSSAYAFKEYAEQWLTGIGDALWIPEEAFICAAQRLGVATDIRGGRCKLSLVLNRNALKSA